MGRTESMSAIWRQQLAAEHLIVKNEKSQPAALLGPGLTFDTKSEISHGSDPNSPYILVNCAAIHTGCTHTYVQLRLHIPYGGCVEEHSAIGAAVAMHMAYVWHA